MHNKFHSLMCEDHSDNSGNSHDTVDIITVSIFRYYKVDGIDYYALQYHDVMI